MAGIELSSPTWPAWLTTVFREEPKFRRQCPGLSGERLAASLTEEDSLIEQRPPDSRTGPAGLVIFMLESVGSGPTGWNASLRKGC